MDRQLRAAGMTLRGREILHYVVDGRTYCEITQALVISEKTVSSHISHLLPKTGASNRTDRSGYRRQAAPCTERTGPKGHERTSSEEDLHLAVMSLYEPHYTQPRFLGLWTCRQELRCPENARE